MEYYIFSQSADLNRTCLVCKNTFENNNKMTEYINANIKPNEKYKIVPVNDISNIPFYFLASYNLINDELVPNIKIAKELLKKILRKQREKLFAPLDVAFMRAVERGDVETQKQIGAQKQKLRDITEHPAINAATTVEELRDITLEKLLAQ
jgi:hypothetical protein